MKFILLHHRLGGYSSHHYNESQGFRTELARRGEKLLLLVSARAEPRAVRELQARAILDDDPTFRLEWSFAERSRRFVAMLHARVSRFVKRGDCVLVTIATQLETHALARWLQALPERKKPWVVALFLSDRWNRSGPEEYARQLAELHELRATLATLSPDDARKLILFGVNDLLAEELSGLLATKVAWAPMPLLYGTPPPSSPNALPRVAILGGTRREKGSYRIPEIIRACRSYVDVEFLVHLTNNSLTPSEVQQLAAIAHEPGVTVIDEPLTLPAYESALSSADVALFPYEPIPYTKRGSGVFGEAVAFGKPVVVTPGTSMARELASNRAAGAIADDTTPDAYARAIAHCITNLDTLRKTAQSLSTPWRQTISLPAFVDQVQAEIANRALSEKPRRWLWF